MIEKRPWPDGATSPWAGEEERPSVLEVARAYPGRAVAAAIGAVVIAMIVAAFLMWGVSVIWSELLGRSLVTAGEAILVPVALLAPIFWWHLLDGEIRGWWTTGGG